MHVAVGDFLHDGGFYFNRFICSGFRVERKTNFATLPICLKQITAFKGVFFNHFTSAVEVSVYLLRVNVSTYFIIRFSFEEMPSNERAFFISNIVGKFFFFAIYTLHGVFTWVQRVLYESYTVQVL